MIQLGNKVRDVVTGVVGIATARVEYLNGCVQYCIKQPINDGKLPEGEYIDHQQLEVVDGGVTEQLSPARTGGPSKDAPSDSYRG
jgi:hypothetical protein